MASGEGYNAEFKVSVPSKVREITEEICAFANAAGGVMLLGVNDLNEIVGANLSNAKRSAIQNSLHEITPSLHCSFYIVDVEGKQVGVIEVSSGPQKPYVLSGAIYVRIGPNSQKLTTVEEMRDFFQQADRIYFDEAPCQSFDASENLDERFLREFRAAANLSVSISDEQVLENLKLNHSERIFKNGAVLFFAKNPELFFDTAVVRCVAFDGTEKTHIIDDKKMVGPLYQQYVQAMQWLRSKLDVKYIIKGSGPREEEWEIPETTLKEALINALSHRDYYDKGATITVELFNNRVDIVNPGGLVSAIRKEDFGKRSHSRNPLIFGLFERMDMVEQIGSGISRMKDLMVEAKLPPPLFFFDGMFVATFFRPIPFESWINSWSFKLKTPMVKILIAVYENPNITKPALGDVIGQGKTSVDNYISHLKSIGILRREGSNKAGRWVINLIMP